MPAPKRSHPFIIFIFLLICHFSYGQTTDPQEYYLYEDSAKTLTGESAIKLFNEGKFTKETVTEINLGFTRSVFWLAYQNDQEYPTDSLLFYIGHHHINRIHFFYANDSSIQQQWITGDYFSFKQRPVIATGFYFPVDKKGLYIARIDKSNESLQLSWHLISRLNAFVYEAEDKTVLAFFTGMMLLMIIFGIYLFIVTLDKMYIWYILYIGSGWLWVLSNAGYGFEYLWPNTPWFASKARPVFALAPLFFSMLFLIPFIGGVKNKKIFFIIKATNLLLLVCIIFILFFNEEGYQSNWWLYIQYFIPLIALLYVIIILLVLIVEAFRGNRYAQFYLLAVITLMTTSIMQVTFSLGGLNRMSSFFSSYLLSIGYVVEAIILTAGLVYRFNQYRLEKVKLLVEMNKQQQENTKILMEVQEAERSQIANQLHDVAGSLLSAAKLNLSSLKETGIATNEKVSAQLDKTEEAVDQVADMVRNLSHALSPVMMEQVGFKTALEKVIGIFNASGRINIQLLVLGFEKYDAGLSNYYTALYSIIYELLNNVVKHSGAKNVLLQVSEHANSFTLIAEDDGRGIDITQTAIKESLGLAGIQSKVNYLKGVVAFDKNQPTGLIVTIEIPITYDNK